MKELNLDWEGLVLLNRWLCLHCLKSQIVAFRIPIFCYTWWWLPSWGFPSSALHGGACLAFLFLCVSAMKTCESFWLILLPPANSLFSILWPTQAYSLPSLVCLTIPVHRVCLQFSFCRQQHLISPQKVAYPSTNLGPWCLSSVILWDYVIYAISNEAWAIPPIYTILQHMNFYDLFCYFS